MENKIIDQMQSDYSRLKYKCKTLFIRFCNIKKKIVIGWLMGFLLFACLSCGGIISAGVTGSIEKYEFTESADSLKAALNRVYKKYPNLIKTDTILYGKNNGEDYLYIVKDQQDTTVFICNVITYDNEKTIELSLTSAVTWGQGMKLAPRMGFWEKRRYRRIFEDKVLPKIKEEIK